MSQHAEYATYLKTKNEVDRQSRIAVLNKNIAMAATNKWMEPRVAGWKAELEEHQKQCALHKAGGNLKALPQSTVKH